MSTDLSHFIVDNLELILDEWERFARTIVPVTSGMNRRQLRDEAAAILCHVAADMQEPQNPAEQQAKSEGRRAQPTTRTDTAAEKHGEDRLNLGFSLVQMVSEYRALRASVIRLWTAEIGDAADRKTLDQLTRFNEAIDEALSESIVRFMKNLDRARDLLLGVLGHDLRVPLGAILMSATYLLAQDELNVSATKAATRVYSSATRMKHMVSDLLDFAATRMGGVLPVVRVSMDMEDACRRAVDEVAAWSPHSTLLVQSNGPVVGEWDVGRISQLLANLLGNAVQHGSRDAPVEIAVSGSEKDVLVAIRNDGVPIPPHELKTIFEPMVRGKRETVSSANVGLGLYIAREIARAHGGSIGVESSDGGGTTFTTILPRHQPSPHSGSSALDHTRTP